MKVRNNLQKLKAQDYSTHLYDDPVRRLLIAIMERALIDLSDHTLIGWHYHADGTPVRQRDLAFKWILSDDEHNPEFFTFIQICDELGLDLEAARKQILTEYAKRKPKHDKTIRGSYNFPRTIRPGRMCRKDRTRASSANRQ